MAGPDEFAPLTAEGHGLGWNPRLEEVAKVSWAAQGMPPKFAATPFADDDRPLPPAFSLSSLILWWYNQGPVGTCYANAGTQSMQIDTAAAINAGEEFQEGQLSRAFTAYQACLRDNPSGRFDVTQGGSITNTIRGLHEAGCAWESAFPYKPSARWLNQAPSAEAVAQGKVNRLTGAVALKFEDAAARKRMILNGNAPVAGLWWAYGWDQGQIDQYGRTKGVGSGVFGHALPIVGWVDPGVWDGHLWWHYVNSHGPIYPLPSAEMRAKVPGYASARPDACYSFWVRDDMEAAVVAKGWAELVAPAGIAGFKIRRLVGWDQVLA